MNVFCLSNYAQKIPTFEYFILRLANALTQPDKNLISKLKKLTYGILGNTNVLLLQSRFPNQEEQAMRLKRKAFYTQFLSQGDLFFDVGANYGNRILPIIDEGIRIVAFEPQKECVAFLKKRFGNKIHIESLGLDEKPGRKSFFIASTNTLSTFSQQWIAKTQESKRFGETAWHQTRTVEMSTLDLMIAKHGIPSFVKIDVEGYEMQVLKGLNTAVNCISIEYAVPEYLEQSIECIERVEKINAGQVVCNYSIGESMEWALNEWMAPQEFIKHLQSDAFISTQFGDIYLKRSL